MVCCILICKILEFTHFEIRKISYIIKTCLLSPGYATSAPGQKVELCGCDTCHKRTKHITSFNLKFNGLLSLCITSFLMCYLGFKSLTRLHSYKFYRHKQSFYQTTFFVVVSSLPFSSSQKLNVSISGYS